MKIFKKWTKLDNRGESSAEFLLLLILVVMVSILSTIFFTALFDSIEVHAAEPETTPETKSYHVHTMYNYSDGYVIDDFTFTLTGEQVVVGYKWSEDEYSATYMFYLIDDDFSLGGSHWINRNCAPSKLVRTTYKASDDKILTNENTHITIAWTHTDILINMFKNNAPEFGSEFNLKVSDMSTILCDVPLFDNAEALEKYLTTGDNSGMVNKPAPDYNYEYDFSNYQYDINIPLPELSQVTHNGFKVDNVDGYYLDIIMESRFYGVRLTDERQGFWDKLTNKVSNDYMNARVDKDWVYAKRNYNFTVDDRAINSSLINIKDIYEIDNVSLYFDEFKQWSSEYNSIRKLPTFQYKYIGSPYPFLYDEVTFNSFENKEDYLRNLGQCETTYYVRFYNKDMSYGQWVRFVYGSTLEKDTVSGLPIYSGSISNGTVDGVGVDGKPIVGNTMNGRVDSSGNIDYSTSVNDYNAVKNTDIYMDGFKETLNSFTSAIGQLPELVNKLFGFLPWWATALLGCVIVVCVILRVVGR